MGRCTELGANVCPAYGPVVLELRVSAGLAEATDRIAPEFQIHLSGGSDR